jgi:hypothetical protein
LSLLQAQQMQAQLSPKQMQAAKLKQEKHIQMLKMQAQQSLIKTYENVPHEALYINNTSNKVSSMSKNANQQSANHTLQQKSG